MSQKRRSSCTTQIEWNNSRHTTLRDVWGCYGIIITKKNISLSIERAKCKCARNAIQDIKKVHKRRTTVGHVPSGRGGGNGGINSKIETKGILRSPSPGVGFSLIWTYTSFSCQDFLDEGAPLPLHFKKNDDRCPQRTTVGGMNAIFSLHYLNNSSDLHVKVTGNCNRYKINKIRHSTISNIYLTCFCQYFIRVINRIYILCI